jgi:hypothetical protein
MLMDIPLAEAAKELGEAACDRQGGERLSRLGAASVPSSFSRDAKNFVDRRGSPAATALDYAERRQFANSYAELSPEARELASAIDHYKFRHRRRYIDYEEMLAVIKALGYLRPEAAVDSGPAEPAVGAEAARSVPSGSAPCGR